MVQVHLPLPIRPGGQAVKTPPFHGGNTGSIPVRVTTRNQMQFASGFFILFHYFLLKVENVSHETKFHHNLCARLRALYFFIKPLPDSRSSVDFNLLWRESLFLQFKREKPCWNWFGFIRANPFPLRAHDPSLPRRRVTGSTSRSNRSRRIHSLPYYRTGSKATALHPATFGWNLWSDWHPSIFQQLFLWLLKKTPFLSNLWILVLHNEKEPPIRLDQRFFLF